MFTILTITHAVKQNTHHRLVFCFVAMTIYFGCQAPEGEEKF
jgi:hypothetical protein